MSFDCAKFVERAIPKIQAQVGNSNALIALSGGVDSSVAAALVNRALGKKLKAVFLDTGFMREGEPESVRKNMFAIGLEVEVRDVKEEFFGVLKGVSDAEEKRKIFRETFYNIFGRESKTSGCEYLVQGTIAPDWIETQGGIKSQHNVLEQIGIDSKTKFGFKVLEPLAYLYKDQVRELGKYLGLSEEVFMRQPFPGPGLMVRCVGEVKKDKVASLSKSVAIVEKGIARSEAQQYFAAVFDSKGRSDIDATKTAQELLNDPKAEAFVFEAKGTGVKGDLRKYGNICGLSLSKKVPLPELEKKQLDIIIRNPEIARVLVKIEGRGKGPYCATIRAIRTRDFMTCGIVNLEWARLESMAAEILAKCPNIADVYYDVTPKPPATVEFE